MNTPKSMALGWGSLVVVAGASFYYAKKNINERRKQQEAEGARPSAKLDWQARIAQDTSSTVSTPTDDPVTKSPPPPVAKPGRNTS